MLSLRSENRQTSRGFTLIELLVVIAIIGILASLVSMGYGRMKASSTAAGCAGNLRQIGMALAQYATDNGNFFPPAYGGKGTWSMELVNGGYIQDTRIFKCPGDNITKSPIGKTRSYAYCSTVMNNGKYMAPGDLPTPLNRLNIQSPTKQYMLTEWHSSDPGAAWDGGGTTIAGWDIINAPMGHSAAGYNFLFADGHVELRPKAKAADAESGWVLNEILRP